MHSVDEIINTSQEVREVKRALSVKMLGQGLTPQHISELLNVSLAWVSKWHRIYTAEGVAGLYLQYQGSPGYLTETERRDLVAWIAQHPTLTVEAVRDYVEAQYGVTYQSKQSYYDLLAAGGLSHHRSEPVNPKRDEAQVQAQREVIKKKLTTHQAEIQRGELIVLLEDECHVCWGDGCGQVWGKRNQPIAVAMTNQRQRQTYYGSLNLLTQQFQLSAFAAGNGQHTLAYVRECQSRYPNKKLLFLWDGASDHRSHELKTFLAQENAGLAEGDWKVTCLRFAPNAPEQNPVEDVWLKGKNYLRKHFADHKTFAQVKQSFAEALNGFTFSSIKFSWYWS